MFPVSFFTIISLVYSRELNKIGKLFLFYKFHFIDEKATLGVFVPITGLKLIFSYLSQLIELCILNKALLFFSYLQKTFFNL